MARQPGFDFNGTWNLDETTGIDAFLVDANVGACRDALAAALRAASASASQPAASCRAALTAAVAGFLGACRLGEAQGGRRGAWRLEERAAVRSAG